MIVQFKSDNVKYIYTPDASSDYMKIAANLNLCDGNTLKPYATAMPATIRNACGLAVNVIVLTGYNDTYYIVNDSCTVNIKQADCLDAELYKTIINGFNFFDNAILELCGKRYYGPFTFPNGRTHNTIMDKEGKCIMLSSTRYRDIDAINTLLSRLDYDNGKMYEPMFVRYLNILAGWRDKSVLPIGYFNFDDYLRIIKSKAALLFNKLSNNKTKPTVLIRTDGKPSSLRVKSIDNNRPVVELVGNFNVIDLNKNELYNPFVIVSLKPFNIANTKFPWAHIKHRGVSVYMAPIVCPEDKLKALHSSINLLG